MPNATDKLSRLAELEWMRAEIMARRMAQRVVLIGIAALISILALTALSYGIFLILAASVGATYAALIIGGVLAVIAAIIIVLAMRSPGRTAELEAHLLERSINDARSELLDGFSDPREGFGGGSSNLATIITVLNAVSALSPTLAGYIQPILKIIR